MRIMKRVAPALAALMTACGSPSAPAVVAIAVSANPTQVTAALCGGCGAGSTDREAQTTLTVQEPAGVAGAVTLIEMSLRESGTNTVLASGSFDSGAIAQLAGTNRFAARGTLIVPCGVHYAASLSGRTATPACIVHVTEDRGNQVTQTVTVTVAT
jgi:hypothetical protein